ncbi:hypothetical protein [Paenibacillus polymyxa]|uniref:hypothetical protein n=1 Tax=Paenibacillus polymyxa TaxID=1406 RepID=UPI001869506D|nr:hypothetical protein [Paenibacillus polymyxa]MBE3650812.1 hypothetical protein [Paenibacillus polymyxa]
MEKQKKIMITSLGVVVLLIVAVLVLRQPQQDVDSTAAISGTSKQQVSVKENTQSAPKPAAEQQRKSKTDVSPSPTLPKQDESHEKVTGILDMLSDTVSSKVPSLWDGVKNAMDWLLAFDTKHLVILAIIIFVFLGSIGNVGSGSKKKENGR